MDFDSERDEYTIHLLADSIIYKAHFPGMPVTPGVCLIKIARELYQHLTGESTSLQSVSNAKFLNVVNPLDTPEIKLQFKKIERVEERGERGESIDANGERESEMLRKVQCIFHSDNTIYTKLSLSLKLL
ncbi:MAG: hypothetical protein K2L89_02840 [Muribaculaceae bacterium]|nr:hypothetical protein [Muribaculaceae bacterium]